MLNDQHHDLNLTDLGILSGVRDYLVEESFEEEYEPMPSIKYVKCYFDVLYASRIQAENKPSQELV